MQKWDYHLVSNIRCTSNIRRTPTLGNSQLEFSLTISLAKTSNTRRTPSFDFWVSIVDKVRSRPTWSELLRVAWDFDSPWIKGPMTPYQSRSYARHVAVKPAAKLCDSIAIAFLSIEVRALLHRALFYCSAARRCAALPRGAINWIQLISTGIFTLASGSLAARGKLGPWANLRRRCRRCARFGTNPPAGEVVPCVKEPFRPLAAVPLPLTNSHLCKRSSGNGAARERRAALRCSKTAPCVKAA